MNRNILHCTYLINFLLAFIIVIVYKNSRINLILNGVSAEHGTQPSIYVFLLCLFGVSLSFLLSRINTENMFDENGIQLFQYRINIKFFDKNLICARKQVKNFLSFLAIIVQLIFSYQLLCILFQDKLFGNYIGIAFIVLIVIRLIILLLKLCQLSKP